MSSSLLLIAIVIQLVSLSYDYNVRFLSTVYAFFCYAPKVYCPKVDVPKVNIPKLDFLRLIF